MQFISLLSRFPITQLTTRTLVDDALKANHREQTAADGGARDQNEDNDSEQAASVWAARLLQELALLCSSHVGKRRMIAKRTVVVDC